MDKDKQKKAPVNKYYTVKLDVKTPVTLTFKVLAESPEEALKLITSGVMPVPVASPKIHLSKMQKLKAMVYDAGTSILRLTKNFT